MFHQYYYFIWEVYQRGEFPLWNPYYLSGVPIFVNVGFGFLSPFAVLGSLLYDPSHSYLCNATEFVNIALLIVFIGNIGVYLLLREFGISRPIAVIGSIWYAFSGVNIVKNIYLEEAAINYLFPVVVYSLYKYVKYGNIRYLICNSVILAVIISTNHVILIIYTYLHYVLLSILAIMFSFNYKIEYYKNEAHVVFSRSIFLFLPLLGGAILASIAIFPYMEYLRNASMGGEVLTLKQIEQMQSWRCITHIFTALSMHNYTVLSLISIGGLFFYKHEFKKYIIIMLTFYFVLGLKQYGLIERLIYIFTPLGPYLEPRHYHYAVWYFVPLYTVILFAFGLETCLGNVPVGRDLKLVPIVLGIICLLIMGYHLKIHKLFMLAACSLELVQYAMLPGFLTNYLNTYSVDESQLVLYFFLWVLFSTFLLRVLDKVQESPAKALCVFMLLLVVLHPNHSIYSVGLKCTKSYDELKDTYLHVQRTPWEKGIHEKRHMTLIDAYSKESDHANYSTMIYKKQFDIFGYARLWPKRYREFLQAANVPVMGDQGDPWRMERSEGPIDFHLVQLLDVDFDEVQKKLESNYPSYAHAHTEYKPFNRFEIIPEYVVETSENAIIPKMRDLDLRRYVVLEKEPQFHAVTRSEASDVKAADNNISVCGVTVQKFSERSLKLRVNCTHANAFLFYSQNYYPGWKAWVDNVRTPVYQADYTFQAIPITKGEHSVILEFDPWLFKVSKWITIISCLAAIVLLIRAYNWKLPESLNVKL